MGCSSIYCGISKLPINAGKMVMIPIVKSGVNLESSHSFCGMPIYGTYNEYSSMDNIEETEYTKQLSEYFNMGIEDIVKHIMWQNVWSPKEYNGDERLTELSNIEYFPIDREVWDSMVLGMNEIISEQHYDCTPNIDPVLKFLGFEFDRGTRRYTKENESAVFVKNGGKTSVYLENETKSIYIKNKNIDYPCLELSNFITIPEDKKWVLDASYRELAMLMSGKELLDNYEWMLYRVSTTHKKPNVDKDFINKTFEKINNLGDSESDQVEKDRLFDMVSDYLDNKISDNMTNIYLSNPDEYKSEIISLYFLECLMRAYSTPLQPINPFYVCQGGEMVTVNKLINKLQVISNKRYEEYIKW